MDGILSGFGQVLNEKFYLAALMALFAGVISSFSPCTLTSIPLLIGYVGGYSGGTRKRALRTSIIFSLGMIVTFSVLGAVVSLAGRFFTLFGSLWYIILGIIMVFISLNLLGIINIFPDACKVTVKKKGMFGAFLFGILGGIFTSPCSTPVLAAILAFASSRQNMVESIILLLLYSIGNCVLIIVAGTSVGFVQQLAGSEKTQKTGKILMKIMGILILLLAFYLFYLGF